MQRAGLAAIAAIFLSILALPCVAQTTAALTPAPTPAPVVAPPTSIPGWNVLINGAFSTANGNTNNGSALTEELGISSHFAIRADQYLMNSPSTTVALGGVEYRRAASDFIKPTNLTVNTSAITFFVNAELGTAHATVAATAPITQRHFAVGIGGGFDYCLSATVCLRPLDLKYVNGGVMTQGGKVLGNGLQFGAGLNLRF
jgi:hypothetical protein